MIFLSCKILFELNSPALSQPTRTPSSGFRLDHHAWFHSRGPGPAPATRCDPRARPDLTGDASKRFEGFQSKGFDCPKCLNDLGAEVPLPCRHTRGEFGLLNHLGRAAVQPGRPPSLGCRGWACRALGTAAPSLEHAPLKCPEEAASPGCP